MKTYWQWKKCSYALQSHMLKDVEIRSKNVTCYLLEVFKSIAFCFQKSYSKSRPEKTKGY